ncbi:GrpB family protein [Shouchella sp. JSM 1781072]|uniref:GrpB family protein n=1 Tax=Shouchella sp. JSM 1781072 TaxID=3344581 RepID=UPI0035BED6AB
MRKVEVMAYNERWARMFSEEEARLNDIFGNEIIATYHIGSTSVVGLSAKPVIDIMPVVRDINHVDEFNESMVNIGYSPKGENGIAKRRYFEKGGDNRTHHVHIYQSGSHEIMRHLAFREFLKEHPNALKAYSQMKERLAKEFPHNIKAYINGKDEFVKDLEMKALAWYGVNELDNL